MKDIVIAYTDGSSNNNSKERYGGFGAVLLWGGHERTHWEGFRGVTNNQMELLGIIWVLETVEPGYRIRVNSDSKYCIDSINKWLNDWIKYGELKYKKNSFLWERYIQARDRHPAENLTFNWVKGHVGIEHNELADQLAKEGYKAKIDRELLR